MTKEELIKLYNDCGWDWTAEEIKKDDPYRLDILLDAAESGARVEEERNAALNLSDNICKEHLSVFKNYIRLRKLKLLDKTDKRL
jgi:hypothetical protein